MLPLITAATGFQSLPVPENLEFVPTFNSRMTAVKDKLVNIPIHENHVLLTFEALPIAPSEAGLTINKT